MKTKLSLFSTLIVLILTATFCGKDHDALVDKQLQLAVDLINKTAPVMVDEVTRLDGAELLPNKTLKYNYTLLTYSFEDLDMNIFETEMKSQLLNNIVSNPSMAALKQYGVVFIFSYKDKNNASLLELKFTSEDYK